MREPAARSLTVAIGALVSALAACSVPSGARLDAGGGAGLAGAPAAPTGDGGDAAATVGSDGAAGAPAAGGASGIADAAIDVAAPADGADSTPHDTAEETRADGAVSSATWTGTWGASPVGTGTTFNRQTLREIVHTSIGGAAARLRFSNVFGTIPLVIGDVHVARRVAGSSIDAATDATATFAGQPSVTIAPGADAVSDRVAFAVPPLADVAVSFYLPQATGPATAHAMASQTNYVTDGDASGSATLTGARTNGGYFFLTSLEVDNAAAEGAVVTFGASITDGVASASDSNKRWPNDLAVRLAAAGRTIGVINEGISGNQLLVDGAGQSASHRFDRDVLSQANVRWVIVSDDPINDLGDARPVPTAATLIAALADLARRAHAGGVKFLCSTLTPFQGAGYWTAEGETGREAVNAFVRGADSGCDGVVDQDAATHDPTKPTWYLPGYDAGDHLHPNEAGLQAIANAVDLARLTP